MQHRLIHSQEGQRTFVLVLDAGEEVIGGLRSFADLHRLSAAQIAGLGACSSAMLGFFERERRDYRKIPVEEQTEVLALTGNITLAVDQGRQAHVHVVLGKRDGTAIGGHLLEAQVWPTLELVVTESAAHLRRRSDQSTGLALIDIPAGRPGPDAA